MLYWTISTYHSLLVGSFFAIVSICLLIRQARAFVTDTKIDDFLFPNDESTPPDFVVTIILGAIASLVVWVIWPAIYFIGIPVGICFGLRNLCRKYKTDKKKTDKKTKKQVKKMENMIRNHEKEHHNL